MSTREKFLSELKELYTERQEARKRLDDKSDKMITVSSGFATVLTGLGSFLIATTLKAGTLLYWIDIGILFVGIILAAGALYSFVNTQRLRPVLVPFDPKLFLQYQTKKGRPPKALFRLKDVPDHKAKPQFKKESKPKLDESGKPVHDADGKPTFESVLAINKKILSKPPERYERSLINQYLYALLEEDRAHDDKAKSYLIGHYLFLSSVVSLLLVLALTLMGISGGLPPFMLQNTNGAPIPNAGPDLIVSENSTVMLNASASRDAESSIKSYLWNQTSGPPVALSGYNDVMPTFVAPNVNNTVDFEFKVTVADDQNQNASDTMIVRVENSSKILLDCTIPTASEHKTEGVIVFVTTASEEEAEEDFECMKAKPMHYIGIDEVVRWPV